MIPTESKRDEIARPRVRAIVVNWNGAHLLAECLNALLAQAGSFELRASVVDNGSSDGSIELLKREFPQIDRIELPENLGYGRANNVWLERAINEGEDFALLVNNDVTLEAGFIEALIAAARAQPRAALFTGTLLFRDADAPKTGKAAGSGLGFGLWGAQASPRGTLGFGNSTGQGKTVHDDGSSGLGTRHAEEIVNSTGLVIDWFCRATDRDIHLPREKLHRPDGPVDGVSGGAALLRCAALREIGLFDPDYFAYYEDVDLSLRAKKAGWSCWYAGAAIARHRFGATFGPGSPRQRFLLGRNHLKTAARHLPGVRAAAVVAGTVAYRLAISAPREMLRGKAGLAMAEMKAAAAGTIAAVPELKRAK